ncbi:hypothetical protein AAD018_011525 [Aestuariibius insulae]|uniref:hypothetical protein n=1 Tax=Aestuariibius insulae TaxID=2058287 RepID=UPI00345E8242
MADFPADLAARFGFRGYAEGAPTGAVISTAMSLGPAKRRPRSTTVIEPISGRIRSIRSERVDAFLSFFKEDLRYGALSFGMPHPRTKLIRTWTFSGPDGAYTIVPRTDEWFDIDVNLDLYP